MNTMSTLQTVARLDSERVFRRVIDLAMDTATEQLLEWVRFQPEQFGIETPRHLPILAKKIVLPHYALLSDDAQSDTVEKICEQLETDSGMFFTYALDSSLGIISVYVSSVEVDATTLIDLFDRLDEEDFDDEDEDEHEDEDPDFFHEPELLIGADVLVNDLLRTVVEVDAGEMTALLDDGSTIDIEEIEVDPLDNSYFIPEPENFGVDRAAESAARDARDSQTDDEDDEDEEDDDSFEEETPAVVVPQIRDTSESEIEEQNDDDFPEEELQPVVDTVNEEQALAAAIAEEQNEQAEVVSAEPVAEAPVSAVEGTDDTFAEEEQSEAGESAQTEAQAPVETTEEQPSAGTDASESEMARRVEILESVKEQLPNDSVSEIKDNVLTIFMVKGDKDYELTITLTQQLFAGERMIDIFVLASKDGSVGKRSTNAAAVLATIEEL